MRTLIASLIALAISYSCFLAQWNETVRIQEKQEKEILIESSLKVESNRSLFWKNWCEVDDKMFYRTNPLGDKFCTMYKGKAKDETTIDTLDLKQRLNKKKINLEDADSLCIDKCFSIKDCKGFNLD